MMQNSRNNY